MNFDYNVDKQEITVELNSPSITLDTPTGGRGLQGIQGIQGPRGETGPRGEQGIQGETGPAGQDGNDGFSPVVSTSKSGKTTTVTITDADGEKTATILDGDDGQNGQDGVDGVSPIITTSKSGKTTTITIVDAEGTKTATIQDGNDGASAWGNITGDIEDQTDLNTALSGKQATLVSGTNIKTINNTSLLGSGDITVAGASAWGDLTGTLSNQTDLQNALDGKAEKSLYGDTTINIGRKASTTVGTRSTAEGINTTASGNYSHAEGYQSTASGTGSHAEAAGWANAQYAHAEGTAYASGTAAHAEGWNTRANGNYSHVEGEGESYANGKASHVEGLCTIARSDYQHVFGKYNTEDANSTYVEIVGNGTANNARSNARTLDWSGNEVLAGSLTINGNQPVTTTSSFKTINNESIVGSGNIDIQGGSEDYTDLTNKPQINGVTLSGNKTTSDLGITIPTKVSDLTNDTGFITNTVNNLTNYYTSSNTYTKTEVDQLIGAISTLDIQIVQTLPATGSTSTIYLVPKTASTNDNYDEYIYVSNSWEHIGSTEVDLSNYYTKTQVDGLLNDKADTSDIPTKVSDLTNDAGYITGYTETDPTVPSHVKSITQANITSWNNKSTFSGSYNDLTNKPIYDVNYISLAVGSTITNQQYQELVSAINNGQILKANTNLAWGYTSSFASPKVIILGGDNAYDIYIISKESNNHTVTLESEGHYASEERVYELEENVSSSFQSLFNDIAQLYNSTTTYNVGDYVLSPNEPILYKCISQTTGTWDSTKWTQVITMEEIKNKQDTLVSGTNIKTINSTSLLGSGDISISSGASNLENGTGTGSLKSVGASLAAGDYSFAEGRYTTANSSYSHVEGNGTTTNGSYSHAEGLGSWTAQSGGAAHAEGYYTTARGYSSHSEGYYTEATSMAQHVQGKFNIVDSSGVYADIVGNGTDENTRSNAYTLDWSGNGVYAGSLTINGNQTVATTSDLSSKQDALVSGTNIKTINNNSLLGSGDLSVGDALPIGTEVTYDGASVPNGWVEVDNPFEYSTDEQKIGTWIDGKPIYRKVIDCGGLTNATTKNVTHGISNIDMVTNYTLIAKNPTANAYITIPYTNKTNIVYQVETNIDATKIVITCGDNKTGYTKTYAIIEYTKTTD